MIGRYVVAAMIGGAIVTGAAMMPQPAMAQGGACYDLWYQRNEIYARNGYCFRTERARRVFGPGCFPPYGRLSGYEAQRVREIQYEEDRMGCPR